VLIKDEFIVEQIFKALDSEKEWEWSNKCDFIGFGGRG
jgi:hypothetical protein